ncbi:hypothetical protein Tco_0616229 [Tanacetum coccineum]
MWVHHLPSHLLSRRLFDEEILAPPRKSKPSPLPPPPPSPPPSPSSPSSSASPSPPPAILPPRKGFRMTSPHHDTTTKATTEVIPPARLHKRISDLEFRLEDTETRLEDTETNLEVSEARKIELGARVRALEDHLARDSILVSHVATKELKQMMTDEYCPRNEVQKMETELWNLSVKGTDIVGYTKCFQELALLYPTMVTPEYKNIKRYI